jgi:hypothetical protein
MNDVGPQTRMETSLLSGRPHGLHPTDRVGA